MKDIVIFAVKFHNFSKDLNVSFKSVLRMKNLQIPKLAQGKFAVAQRKTGKTRAFVNTYMI